MTKEECMEIISKMSQEELRECFPCHYHFNSKWDAIRTINPEFHWED